MIANHVQIGASYGIPITNTGRIKDIYNDVSDNISMKNKEWQIRLNYFF